MRRAQAAVCSQPSMNKTGVLAFLSIGLLSAAVIAPAAASADPASESTGNELSGKTVFLDPGHQGTGHSEDLTRQVDDGRGGTKNCQTTGMTSLGGVPEHTINWNVSQLVKSSLESLGATVVTSRADDTGWGGCVDERAEAATRSGADVAVSIHADSTSTGPDENKHGFHLIVPTLPIPDAAADAAQSAGGRQATSLMRDAYERAGFTPANYAGVTDGVQERSDVAGPALAGVPLVFVEMGNGSNPSDADTLETTDGQLKHAIALSTGIIDYLLGPDTSVTPDEIAAETDAESVPSLPTVPSAADSTAGNSLSRLLSELAPYVDAGGGEADVRAVADVAQGLLRQILTR